MKLTGPMAIQQDSVADLNALPYGTTRGAMLHCRIDPKEAVDAKGATASYYSFSISFSRAPAVADAIARSHARRLRESAFPPKETLSTQGLWVVEPSDGRVASICWSDRQMS